MMDTDDDGIGIPLPAGIAPLAWMQRHEELASTNSRGLELARDPHLPLPGLILAERQTAGRGRGGHRWHAGTGALTCSWLLSPNAFPQGQGGLVALAAGLAVRDAVSHFAPQADVRVKWPNDIVVRGRKLAGILVETASGGTIVVGIGVNVQNDFSHAPPEILQRAISLREFATGEVDRERVLAEILHRFPIICVAFHTAGGVPLDQWSPVCALTGQQIRFQAGGQHQEGECLGPAPDGHLRVRIRGVEQRFPSGEAIEVIGPTG